MKYLILFNLRYFILPSMHETFGLVINEAMIHENAIISSKFVGSHADFIKK